MEFEITQVIDAPLDAVEPMLFDAEFVAATSALPRLDDCLLISVKRDDGEIRAQIHRRFGADLSGAARRAIDPAKLTWTEHVTYDTNNRRSRHVIDPDHYADRLKASYTSVLVSDEFVTRRTTTGSLSVRAPFVARKIEAAIIDGLDEYARAEAVLLGKWAAR